MPQRPALIVDFDGTMTRKEFYELAVEEFVDRDISGFWEDYVAGRLTHFEALDAIFGLIARDEAHVLARLAAMELDPATGATLRDLAARGWRVAIASAGCGWYIRHALAAQGIEAIVNPRDPLGPTPGSVEVYTNPGSFRPGAGLRMELDRGSRHFREGTGVDKAGVVREALALHSPVAFLGDGRPDTEAAMLLPPEARFATGWLRADFRSRGVPFRPFDRWTEAAALLAQEWGL
ncbi:MAG: haloacid dehalogenase-like hydrolase [Candidatus Sumerlaeia bacterium]|nr:haloacid dehalogenase-like hydrolase [Candidatus Sumerlaeia bacterium]